ncbi:MAG TPA: ParB N-terminal domain-containing protein, partial [Anaerolineae bacterium]|nr:ParB N-terminal domain-containing protein [Anaerolineae bacterium]
MEFHPIADIFPMMGMDEFLELKEDIEKNGLREPIWTYQGKIIDGRNRYRACKLVGVEPQFREWDGNGSLVAFILSLNLHRRHLTQSQKAVIALNTLPLLEEEAKRRMQAGKKIDPSEEMHEGTGKASEQAGKFLGVSSRYIEEAKRIQKTAPDLLDDIRDGKKTLTEVKKEVKRREINGKAHRDENESAAYLTISDSENMGNLHIPLEKGSRSHRDILQHIAHEIARHANFIRNNPLKIGLLWQNEGIGELQSLDIPEVTKALKAIDNTREEAAHLGEEVESLIDEVEHLASEAVEKLCQLYEETIKAIERAAECIPDAKTPKSSLDPITTPEEVSKINVSQKNHGYCGVAGCWSPCDDTGYCDR